MQLNPSEISELIKSKIQNLATASEARTQGTVVYVTDGNNGGVTVLRYTGPMPQHPPLPGVR